MQDTLIHRANAATVAMLAVVLTACSSSTNLPPNDGYVALGTWGGDNSGMIVSDTAMHLHVGCTFGDVSGRIPITTSGNFDVAGSYMPRAFPVQVGPSVPARFVGHLDGNTLQVTVTVNDTVQHQTLVYGPVKVRFGDEPQMGPCPICRRPIHTQRINRLTHKVASP